MERSEKLVALAQTLEDMQYGKFADPFPGEAASRDQVDRLMDAIDALRIDIGNMRHSIIAVFKDRFDALEGGK